MVPPAERVQQVGQVDVLERLAVESVLVGPLGRRRELLAGGAAAEFVVSRPLLGVLQGGVGLTDLLEAGFGAG
jgi:hypothetical protein